MFIKLVVFALVVHLVLGDEDFVRVKVTRKSGPRKPYGIRQQLHNYALSNDPSIVNESLIDHGDYYYTGQIHVGTPPKAFIVDFDTGSDILWLANENCVDGKSNPCTAQIDRYNQSKSSTSKDLHDTITILYGSGSVNGEAVSDTVGLTLNATKATVESYVFGSMDDIRGFDDTDADGIFGLSFPSNYSFDFKPFIYHLRDNNVFDPPVFTIWLDTNVSGNVLGGEIVFGGVDSERCGETIVTVPAGVIPNSVWWTFNIDSASFLGKPVANNIVALTDSGTTVILVPTDVYNKISKEVTLYPTKVNCADWKEDKLLFEFVVGGQKLSVNSNQLLIQADRPGECYIGIAGSDELDGVWLLGDPLLKNYCQIHNYKDKTLGFTPSKHSNY